MPEPTRSLRSGFLRSCERFAARPALEAEGRTLSYAELRACAASLAATLARHGGPDDAPPLSAVLGQRSVAAYAGVLGALLHGHGYVPLNPVFPVARTRAMLERSGCRAVIVDDEAAAGLDALLEGVERELVLLLPGDADPLPLARRFPRHRVVGRAAFEAPERWEPSPVSSDGIAYLLFTSGSTGTPKGVMVAHRNVLHFVDAMVERYRVRESDRFSQLFDLTFDLSAFDLFVAWERGACVCAPSAAAKLLPTTYPNDARLSVWFSVPSTAALLHRLRRLAPGAYPGLRLGLFCGEALPAELAASWSHAAQNAVVENLYGPTELTIACTLYRWEPERSPAECEQGLVPIGEPLPGMDALVVDDALAEVPPGEAGELLMSGPQLSLGYWRDPERTAAAFVVPPGRTALYYRTGDRVRRARPGEPLRFLGRVDHQIKVQGYRVELGEIEAALREEAGVESAVALGWPLSAKGAEGVVAFLAAPGADARALRERLRARLPAYMLPSEIRVLPEFPLNANGKIDRNALHASLAAPAGSDG